MTDDSRRNGAQLTARRRASAERIRRKIRAEGRSEEPDNPPLIDATDIALGDKPHGNSRYRKEYANFARQMCKLGATDIEVAKGLGISLSCLWKWQSQNDDFFQAFLEGKDACDDRVERALYHRAVGYSHPTVKIMNYQGSPVVVPYIEHLPPDVAAASRWLKSRRKEQWGETQSLQIQGDEMFTDIWNAIATGQVLPMLKGVDYQDVEEEEDA